MGVLSRLRFTFVTLGGAAMIASTFLTWARPGNGMVLFGSLDRLAALRLTGWEHAVGVCTALVALGALLVAFALFGRGRAIARRTDARLALLVVAVAIAVIVAGLGSETASVPADGGGQVGVAQVGPGPGPWVALAGAALALLGLTLPRKGTGTS